MRTQGEGYLGQETSLGVVDHRVVEAIGHHAIVVDAHHIDIADDETLLIDEAGRLDEDLTYLGDEGLTSEDRIRGALSIASRSIDIAAEVLRGESADQGA